MIKRTSIYKLIEEWENKGLLAAAQAENIRQSYEGKRPGSTARLFAIIIGTILLGLGLIFLIASGYFRFWLSIPVIYWELLAILAVIIGLVLALLSRQLELRGRLKAPTTSRVPGIKNLRSKKSWQAWTLIFYGSPVLSTALFVGFLVLINRVYQLPNLGMLRFYTTAAVFMLPLIFLMNSSILLIIFNITTLAILGSEHNNNMLTLSIIVVLSVNILAYLQERRKAAYKKAPAGRLAVLNNLNISLLFINLLSYVAIYAESLSRSSYYINYIYYVAILVLILDYNLRVKLKHSWFLQVRRDLRLTIILTNILFIASLILHSNFYVLEDDRQVQVGQEYARFDVWINILLLSLIAVLIVVSAWRRYFSSNKHLPRSELSSSYLSKMAWFIFVIFNRNYIAALVLSLAFIIFHLALSYKKENETATISYCLLLLIWILQLIFLSEMRLLTKGITSIALAIVFILLSFRLPALMKKARPAGNSDA